MNNKEMTNYEKIEALRKKANIIIAVDSGLRMIGAPILGTLTVLGINKKFVQEESLFKTNKTIALGAESILVSNAIEGAMSAITKRILTKIAEDIDSLVAADEEADEVAEDDIFMENDHVCSCGETCDGNCHCHDINDDGVIADPAESTLKADIATKYADYKIIRVVFKNEDYSDKSCFPLIRHFVSDGTFESEERVHNLISEIANTVGEHTTPDGEEWNEEPAKYEVSVFTSDFIVENCGSIDELEKVAAMFDRAKTFIKSHPMFTSAYCREYDNVGIYTEEMIELEDVRAAYDYEPCTFSVEINYTLPDGDTDTTTVDVEEESPIFAVSQVFDIFQLVAGCENNVDCIAVKEVSSIEDETEENDDVVKEDDDTTNGGNE